jgi:hypothetical protein
MRQHSLRSAAILSSIWFGLRILPPGRASSSGRWTCLACARPLSRLLGTVFNISSSSGSLNAPAPAVRAYIQVRAECERIICDTGSTRPSSGPGMFSVQVIGGPR